MSSTVYAVMNILIIDPALWTIYGDMGIVVSVQKNIVKFLGRRPSTLEYNGSHAWWFDSQTQSSDYQRIPFAKTPSYILMHLQIRSSNRRMRHDR